MPIGWNKDPIKNKKNSDKKVGYTESDRAGEKVRMLQVKDKDLMGRLEQFVPEEPKRRLEDLVVSDAVMARIKTALNRITYHEILYHQWNLKKIDPDGAKVAINLFGPPGTGKSFCAEAIANYLGRKIIRVNYAEIESKYVGETPKNIRAAFQKARETGAVLFFDEADSILGKRLTNVTQSADHGVNVSRSVMLLELDRFDGIVLFATNLARNYDGAFVRRIIDHIEFELPDFDCRRRLWEYLTPSELPISPDVTAEWVAEHSEGLSGGDLKNAVIAAASKAVQREGERRRIEREDILEALKNIRNAKEKVGSASKAPKVKSVEEVPYEKLPEEIKEKLNSKENNSSEGAERGTVEPTTPVDPVSSEGDKDTSGVSATSAGSVNS